MDAADLLHRLLHVLVHAAALDGGDAGAAHFQNMIVLEHQQEGVDLAGAAGHFKDHAVGREVDDLGFVDAGDLPQFGTAVHVGRHLQQQQFPLQAVVGVQFKDLAGDFQTVGLQQQLGDGILVAVGGDGDAADGGVVGGGDRQAVDVEAPAVEQAGDPGQHAALVVHQDADDAAVLRRIFLDSRHRGPSFTP